MLVVFPTGFWVLSFVLDMVFIAGGGSEFASMAWYSMGAGMITGVVAALPHAASLPARAQGRARTAAIWHLTSSFALLGLFVSDFLIRVREPHGSTSGVVLTCIGMPILAVLRWLDALVCD
jgi:uncharacterized membrane protein